MSALTEITSADLIQTINGKLIVQQSKEFELVNSQLGELSQHLELLELNVVAAEQKDRKEYMNQLKRLKASVQKLEQLYHQLLLVMIILTATITILSVWMALTCQTSVHKSQLKTAAIALIKKSVIFN